MGVDGDRFALYPEPNELFLIVNNKIIKNNDRSGVIARTLYTTNSGFRKRANTQRLKKYNGGFTAPGVVRGEPAERKSSRRRTENTFSVFVRKIL